MTCRHSYDKTDDQLMHFITLAYKVNSGWGRRPLSTRNWHIAKDIYNAHLFYNPLSTENEIV